MKRNQLTVLAVITLLVLQILNSCRHEIPPPSCDTDPLHLNTTVTNASPNEKNGTITATATGGNGFMYSINGKAYQDSGVFRNLAPFTNYNIVAKNSWGCTDSAVVAILVDDPCAGVTINITATKTDASPNQPNGSITATATGGTGFTYSINGETFQSTGNFNNLTAGNYTITAKNSNNCVGTTQVIVGTKDPCAGVTVTLTTTQVNPTTGLSNGSITATATGGTGFTYSLNSGTFQSSGTFTGLAAGNYTLTAKNSNGCIGTGTVSLTAIDPCAGVTVTVSSTKTDPTTGQSNGSITATATGGTGFTYKLNNGAFQSSGTFTGLAAGNYTITAKNSNGCIGSGTVSLIAINPCAGVTITVLTTQVNPTTGQSNGSITASATGGTGFTYSLNNGVFQSSGTFSGLAAGNYTITAKNSNGCLGTGTVSLTAVNPCAGVTVTVSTTQVDPTTGQSNGSITATATGGTGFTYSLNNGAFQSSGTFTGLVTGNYTITAKNSNGCTGSVTVALGSTNPCAGVTVIVNTTQVNPTTGLSNGSITATATGGTGFTYSLNSGAYQASGTFSNLAAGTYTITAKNSNGCLGTTTVTLTAINPCAGVTVTVSTTQVNPTTGQSNGSITATATGGTGFTYSLNSGAYQASGTFGNLAAGTYTITAKNSNGCLGTTTVTLTAIDPCAGVTVTVSTTQVNPTTGQANGSVTATATGGTGFTYSLNSGTYQTSGTFSNLAAGTYTLTAKNSNGCLGTTTVTLTAINPCAGVTVTVSTTQVNPTTGQANGSITATATGGTGFTYSLNSGTYQTSGTFSNLAAGTYTITAKNSNGCLGSASVTLIGVSPCTNLNITITTAIVNNTPCITPATGTITVTASGSSGFTYNINGGAYQTSNVFTALAAATYTIGVKDANGCTKTASAIVANAAQGPLFAQMRNLITTRCGGSGCHLNGQSQKGYNFDNDCSIVTAWSQINQACITYTLTKMPISPQPALTAAEKTIITNWINAGHKITD